MIPWHWVFLTLTCTFAFMLWMPDCFWAAIGFPVVKIRNGQWGQICFVLSSFATLFSTCCHAFHVLKDWIEARQRSWQWKGEKARERIFSLSDSAQAEIRLKLQQKSLLKLNKDSDVYKELEIGNLIKVTGSGKDEIMVYCELKEWVEEYFSKHPEMIKELFEYDKEIIDTLTNFL